MISALYETQERIEGLIKKEAAAWWPYMLELGIVVAILWDATQEQTLKVIAVVLVVSVGTLHRSLLMMDLRLQLATKLMLQIGVQHDTHRLHDDL